MKTITISIILTLCGLPLFAQQLYFVRAQITGGYAFRDNYRAPVQIIAYSPTSDTLLQVKADYTETLNSRLSFNEISSVIYYPRFRTFIFGTWDDRYVLRIEQPDTLVKLPLICPSSYSLSANDNVGIINNHWVYECSTDNRDIPKAEYFRFQGLDQSLSQHFELKATDYKDLYLTGITSQRVELRPKDAHMYMTIVADIENRPPFSVVLPEKYWVDKKTFSAIRVNDEHKTLVLINRVNPQSGEDYGSFHAALYNKDKDIWRDIELKGTSPNIMTYGQWLAGFVRDTNDSKTKFFISDKVSPGKAERDSVYMEFYEKMTIDYEGITFEYKALTSGAYHPGILYLYNTETDKYIEWHTHQSDSEILLVENEIVYYRVFNAIYKAPILNGENLGKAELLVRDSEVVPFIHWAFLSNKSEDEPQE